jgi:hypothetical protein
VTEPNAPATEDTGPGVAVVVPTFRRPERVARLLAALEAQTVRPGGFQVVVVVLAIASIVLARHRPGFAVGALPYAYDARPPLRRAGRSRTFAATVVIDVARVAGCLHGSWQRRALMV